MLHDQCGDPGVGQCYFMVALPPVGHTLPSSSVKVSQRQVSNQPWIQSMDTNYAQTTDRGRLYDI